MKLYVAAILAISFLENFNVCIVRGNQSDICCDGEEGRWMACKAPQRSSPGAYFVLFPAPETTAVQTLMLRSCADLHPREINIRRIANYEIQDRPIKAVIFITKKGVKICVPHDLPWVKKAIKILNQKKAREQRITTTPTAATS